MWRLNLYVPKSTPYMQPPGKVAKGDLGIFTVRDLCLFVGVLFWYLHSSWLGSRQLADDYLMCLSVMWERLAACLQHQFVAKDAGDAGCDAGAMLRPLIDWDFGAPVIAPEPMLLSLLVHLHIVQCMFFAFGYGWHQSCTWDKTDGKIRDQIHQAFRRWTPTEINAIEGSKCCFGSGIIHWHCEV